MSVEAPKIREELGKLYGMEGVDAIKWRVPSYDTGCVDGLEDISSICTILCYSL
jgi:hypothetical protein